MPRVARATLVSLMIVFLWSPAAAQTEANGIRALVSDGQKVVIIDEQGNVVEGRISSIRADGLQLSTDAGTTHVSYREIVRIDRPRDTLLNGTLTGLGVGAAFGFVAVALDGCASFFGCPQTAEFVGVSLIMGGFGSAIGAAFDALIRRDREIYRRGRGTSVAPIVAPGVRAVAVSVSW